MRPQKLVDYIGQATVREQMQIFVSMRPVVVMMRWIIALFLARRGWVKQLYRILLPMKWVLI